MFECPTKLLLLETTRDLKLSSGYLHLVKIVFCKVVNIFDK